MTREAYEPDRASQLRILLRVVLVLVVLMLGWGLLILVGHGSVSTAVRVLLVPGVLLGALATGALRALATEQTTARLWAPATGIVMVVVALLLSQTIAGLLVAVIGVPLLLISVLPGREAEPGAGG